MQSDDECNCDEPAELPKKLFDKMKCFAKFSPVRDGYADAAIDCTVARKREILALILQRPAIKISE